MKRLLLIVGPILSWFGPFLPALSNVADQECAAESEVAANRPGNCIDSGLPEVEIEPNGDSTAFEEDYGEYEEEEGYDDEADHLGYPCGSCYDDDEECLKELEACIFSEGVLLEIEDWLQCEQITDQSSYAIHKSFDTFRNTYHEIVKDVPYRTTFQEETGYKVPIQVQYTKSIGRGIFADADIPKGTLIWQSINTARFDSGILYRKFLHALPPTLACDILHWAYTRRLNEPDRSFTICVDLDEGSYTNSCDADEACAMGWLSRGDEDEARGCKLEFYALRDIEKGEEVRLDYGRFAESGWYSFGLEL